MPSITGTWNGRNIISTPNNVVASAVEWKPIDTIAVFESPFSRQQQFQDWQASFMEATVTMPPLVGLDEARQWEAFLLLARSGLNVFFFGDPTATLMGLGGGPVVNGGSQTGYTLNTKTWPASTAGVLLSGDYFQLGNHLYRNLSDVTTDGSGNATLNIWPNLRETPNDGSPLSLSNPVGLFQLKGSPKWSVNPGNHFGLSFDIRQVIK